MLVKWTKMDKSNSYLTIGNDVLEFVELQLMIWWTTVETLNYLYLFVLPHLRWLFFEKTWIFCRESSISGWRD